MKTQSDKTREIRKAIEQENITIETKTEMSFGSNFIMWTKFEVNNDKFTIRIDTDGYIEIKKTDIDVVRTISTYREVFDIQFIICPECYKLAIVQPLGNNNAKIIDYVTVQKVTSE